VPRGERTCVRPQIAGQRLKGARWSLIEELNPYNLGVDCTIRWKWKGTKVNRLNKDYLRF